MWLHALKNSRRKLNGKRRKKEKKLHAKNTNVSNLPSPRLPLLKASRVSPLRVLKEWNRLKERQKVLSKVRPCARA